MKKLLFPALLSLPILLAGAASVAWSLRPPPAPRTHYSGLPAQRLAHSNGLALTIVRSLQVRRLADGWSITANPGSRYPAQVEVSRADGRVLSGEFLESKRLGQRDIHFRSQVAPSGGASGDELMLEIEAREETSRGRVLYTFYGPQNGSADLLWHVAEGTTLAPP